MARLYRGNAHWLYQQLKRNWIEIHGTEKNLITFAKFKEKMNQGTEIMFAGDSYKINKELSIAFNHDTLTI